MTESQPGTQAAEEQSQAHESESYWSYVWRQFRRSRLNLAAVLAIAVVVLLAVFADFLASDKPLYVKLDGQSYVLPNLFDPPELRLYTNQMLLEKLV